MGRITVFNNVSVDGYFAGPNNEIDWFKISKDDEYAAVTDRMVRSGGTLIFGQITYELMKNFWPTPEARKNDPVIADVMNNSPKIVFSTSMTSAE